MKAVSLLFLLLLSSLYTSAQRDSLSFKIGQMILIGFPGPKVDDNVLKVVKEGKVGSIILFEKNVPKTNSYHNLKKMLYTYQQAAPVPLFIAIDQEGGLVNRLKEKYGFPRSITAKQMGKDAAIDSVKFYSTSTATTLAGLGFNVNFAPVVDVAVNPLNPVIVKTERSFSAHADTVAIMAKEVIAAHREHGIITVLKHFPGHGSSLADSHKGIADVTYTWTENELTPYKNLLANNSIDAVMSAHIVNKKLDARGLPGTLSDSILTGILRNKLGYTGLVFSDDLQMEAITKHYTLEQTIELAINAGIDVLLFCNNVPGSEERKVDNIHQIITQLVKSGKISEQRINQSFQRIMAWKSSINQPKSYWIAMAQLQRIRAEENEKIAIEQMKRSAKEATKQQTKTEEQTITKEKKKKSKKAKQ
ncbi:MAG: glycoside hydrolase family 3 protein [Cyclobacteriaceae bacterium]|jgi:beta-N-acetylhexosaminidase|nr:glycoside hydrolase family 3 protein [Cytophagales bacterium]MCZ8327390.1 glycoside hydrolase family 3 protein [Cyclobacteriaceae bacterium]